MASAHSRSFVNLEFGNCPLGFLSSRKGVSAPAVIADVTNSDRIRSLRVFSKASSSSCSARESSLQSEEHPLFSPDSPPQAAAPSSGRLFDVHHAWEVARQDLLYCDWKARQDILTIKALHDKVVEVLNPLARDRKSIESLRTELEALQQDLVNAHEQVHLSEARVAYSLEKLSDLEAFVSHKLLQERVLPDSAHDVGVHAAPSKDVEQWELSKGQRRVTGSLNVSGPVGKYSEAIRNFWYPVAFSADITEDIMVPFECFEEPWVLFRGKDGRVGCVQDSCVHRACPLHLGKINDGCIQCPYHGWEYSTSGACVKMPSTRHLNVSIRSLPCIEQDGLVWIWPGGDVPDTALPGLSPPAGFTVHTQIVLELPVEHGLLMENLLDLAHAPFTHTTTFARGWEVPSLVKFCTPKSYLKGFWDPYPIDMEFQPPCMVLSTIGLSKPGKLNGNNAKSSSRHLHQLHVCVPSSRGKTRLLYRMELDFLSILKHVPFIQYLWQYLANKVLGEDLRLVVGQQDRMNRGANVWNQPVLYDKLGLRYRLWRLAVESEEKPVSGRG